MISVKVEAKKIKWKNSPKVEICIQKSLPNEGEKKTT